MWIWFSTWTLKIDCTSVWPGSKIHPKQLLISLFHTKQIFSNYFYNFSYPKQVCLLQVMKNIFFLLDFCCFEPYTMTSQSSLAKSTLLTCFWISIISTFEYKCPRPLESSMSEGCILLKKQEHLMHFCLMGHTLFYLFAYLVYFSPPNPH